MRHKSDQREWKKYICKNALKVKNDDLQKVNDMERFDKKKQEWSLKRT